MEKKLFDWESWDEIDSFVLIFHNPTLKVPIGEYKAGDVMSHIVIDFEHGIMTVVKDDLGPAYDYKIHMIIGEKIPPTVGS